MSIKKECDNHPEFKRLINALMRGEVVYKNGKVTKIINYKTPMEIIHNEDIQKRTGM